MKYLKQLTFLTCLIFLAISVYAQEKKALTFDEILKWNRITEKKLSNNGEVAAYKLEPWKGDPVLKLADKDGETLFTQVGGTDLHLTEDSKYLIARIKPREDTIDHLKLEGVKEKKLPRDQLLIYHIESGQKETVPNLESFEVPEKWSGWMAYQTQPEASKDTSANNGSEKGQSGENSYTLHIKKLPGEAVEFPCVTDYVFAEEEKVLAFVSTGNKKDFQPGVYRYDLKSGTSTPVMTGDASYKQLTISDNGRLMAFVADSVSGKADKRYALYLSEEGQKAQKLVKHGHSAIPDNWRVSENGKVRFSESNERIFFGTAPIRPEPDSTTLEEDIPKLDIWHWNEPVLHSRQLELREEKLNKSYLAVYHRDQGRMVQLEDKDFTGIELINQGDAPKVLAWSNLPYAVRRMWEGFPYRRDFYLVDMQTGKAEMFKKNCRAVPQTSPDGNFIYWYQATDTTWNTYHIETGREYTVTRPGEVQCARALHDRPSPASSYGTAGWLEDDEALLVYDRFDIWRVDPQNREEPVNMTQNGRQTNNQYRLIRYNQEDDEEQGLKANKTYHLHGHNIKTRGDRYYTLNLEKPAKPERILGGTYKLNEPIRAKNEQAYLYTRETFQRFPDLLLTEDFNEATRISHANPQQKKFKWGTAELYNWTSADGRKLQGLLVKPEDFDPNKKYPLIVNFYEKSSQNLYDHRVPEADRSTVDYHYYTSNDYIIFNPDVYYNTGYPGQDAFNCVMPGITQLISEGFIDKDHIAAQGHSWGGYQVAYLATRTDLFAAIEAGAPVSNMFSSYGGIRGWSGLNRSFQYEHSQSRIGGSMWEYPMRYLENSPLFWAKKINTPMMIMHNQKDGAVPQSQGIEFFIALRRLRKPAWLLDYREGDHWPTKVRDKYDFQIRLSQFFDHYLKEKPMPEWMKEGIPAVDRKVDMGYELVE